MEVLSSKVRGVPVQALERIIPIAREALTLHRKGAAPYLWLWEHSERVMQACEPLARMPELKGQTLDLVALGCAALFHDAGWNVQVAQGRLEPWQAMARPTSDIQRELGAALLQERVGHLLPAKSVRTAAEAVRRCNDRSTDMLEAQILADAENLDEVGLLYVLRQFVQLQAEGKPLQQLITNYQRQQEYGYWDARLKDGFHFETTRALAAARITASAVFIEQLQRDMSVEDVRSLNA